MTAGAVMDSGTEAEGGRVFFSNTSRSLIQEDEIELTSVGIDIGSATSHLLFSRIVLERFDSRYLVVERRVLHQSAITLTPYRHGEDIDAAALGAFIRAEYAAAGLGPDDVDTGALILTGVAVRRRNARAIGDLFAAQAGKFVAVSAGDALEAVMAAHGSGAAALSARMEAPVVNIDIGGGTTKIAICEGGRIGALTAVEAGARLIACDPDGRILRLERCGRRDLDDLGLAVEIGDRIDPPTRHRVAIRMADRIIAAAQGDDLGDWLRQPPLPVAAPPAAVVFSGGVSEFMHGPADDDFHDLGPDLAREVQARVEAWGVPVAEARQGIRATVVGASQYAVQVSGSTIYLDPAGAVPVRNVAVIAPAIDVGADRIDRDAVADAVRGALRRLNLDGGERPVAVALPWSGSATFARLRALCSGVVDGLAPVLAQGHPLIFVVDGDVGGLIGIHCREEELIPNSIVSIDGIELEEFDFIDIGAVLCDTGAVPVVIKSLLFPTE